MISRSALLDHSMCETAWSLTTLHKLNYQNPMNNISQLWPFGFVHFTFNFDKLAINEANEVWFGGLILKGMGNMQRQKQG